MSMSAKNLTFIFPNGYEIPMVGIGTNDINGESMAVEVLKCALEAGYRLIDTSPMFGSESDIGKALKVVIKQLGLSRNDVFISAKLHPEEHGDRVKKAIEKSLEKLDCDYLDLYLINWPGVYGLSKSSKENALHRDKSWQHMVNAVQDGMIRNIGVCNYTHKHMKVLLQNDHGIRPCMNRIEWHPFCHDKKIYEFCQKENVLIQANLSLGGPDTNELLENKDVIRIANNLNKQPAQILLRWALQQNVSVTPTSTSNDAIVRNMDLNFTIPESDMKVLSNFKKKTRYDWDPGQIS